MKIVLHTSHCPKCNVLKKKLDLSGIEYSINEDMELLQKENPGCMSMPQLQIGEKFLDFQEAIEAIRNKEL